jgi:GT2 family glycosyltransferase
MATPTDSFFVTAIIVSHDGATWLPEVIAALSSQTRKVDRAIAIDTGSFDSSPKLLQGAGIPVVITDREMGFGDSVALALEQAPAIPASVSHDREELLWILHDDVAPAKDALEILIEGIAQYPSAAFVGPKLLGWYDREHLLEVGVSIARNGTRWTGLERGEQDQGQHDQVKEVLSVSSAAMLARRHVFEELDGFDVNLALFRDDVDLGWRARSAGLSVYVIPMAQAFHAQASASERRVIDVSEGFLHRPLLLDRRNAAYVLLANSSWWSIPWLVIQLLGTALIRVIIDIIAKLPGYALDEVGAIGLLIVKPGDLLRARATRRKSRLLTPSVVRRFIPPLGVQIRNAFDRIGGSISRIWNKTLPYEVQPESNIFALQSNSDEEDGDLVMEPVRRLRFKTLTNRPLLFALAFLILLTTFASRTRYGSLSGGALPQSPLGATDLLGRYADSWHLVGLGSAASPPTWLGIMGILSALLLGKAALLITLLFWLAPILIFLSAYRGVKRYGLSPQTSIIGGLVYALSPVTWAAIDQGRLGTIVILILAPTFISLMPLTAATQAKSWRRIYGLGIIAAVLSAFSPAFLAIWSLLLISLLLILIVPIVQRRSSIIQEGFFAFLTAQGDSTLETIKRYSAFLIIPWLINFPWSISLLVHPTQFLQDPGLPLSLHSSAWSVLLFNPGLPAWILSPFAFAAIAITINVPTRKWGMYALLILATAVLLSPLGISGHGSQGIFWTGSLLACAEFLILPHALTLFVGVLPNLRQSRLGLGHIVAALMSALMCYCVLTTALWAPTLGADSLVSSTSSHVIPAFVNSLNQTPSRPKTLVVSQRGQNLGYFISRGNDLQLGDPDIVVPLPPEVEKAVRDLIAGTGVTTSKVLGDYGIAYLYLTSPFDESLPRTIDGIGGFTRSSATSSGIIWKVVGAHPRVSYIDPSNKVHMIPSGDIGAVDNLSQPGVITIAEKYDSGWRLLSNGRPVALTQSANGLPQFQVTEPGPIALSHNATKRRGLLSLQLIFILTVVVLALPAGRRRREVPLEELV